MEDGLVIWLRVSPQVAAHRLAANPATEARPLLEGNLLTRIAALASARRDLYARADVVIDVDERTPDEVAEAIAATARFEAHKPLAPLRLEDDTAATVQTPSEAYPIIVRDGALDDLGTVCRDVGLKGRAFVITEPGIRAHYGETVCASLANAGFDPATIDVEGGEAAKNLATVAGIYDALLGHRAERRDFIVNVGGGVITDMGGFGAATWLRGVPFIHVPTTLLGMVDASVGGKTGVDHARGKNLIGAFAQPRAVVIDPVVLQTLPERERRAGWAEVLTHGFILADELDPPLIDDLESAASDPASLLSADLIGRSVAIKAAIVSEDERESGRRTLLNYGHTTGHAIEAVTGYTEYLHGEAVAIGMHVAGRLSVELGMLDPGALERQQALLRAYGLPERAPGLDADAVLAATRLDKKVSAGSINWVLLDSLGHATTRNDVPDALVRSVLEEILA
jgi:3-dehydroquinate synthase